VSEQSRQLRLVISGYYGFGNLGDEAVLAGLLTGIRTLTPGVSVVVLSADPSATSAVYDVEAVDRGSLPQIWHALREADGLLSGGGSLLQDVTSRRSIYYYLSVMAVARICRRPYCLYGQGIGPIQRNWARRMTRFILDGSCGVWVRDEASLRLVTELCARPAVLSLAGDPAFLLPPLVGEEEHTVSGSPRWVIAVRSWQAESVWWPNLVEALGRAAVKTGASLLFLPMHRGFDSELSSRTARRLRKDFGLSAELSEIVSVHQARRLLSDAHLVIGMRLHALIMGAAEGTPGVAISYDPKVEAFASEAGLPWISLQPLHTASGAERLYQMIIAAWQARSDIRSRLRQHAKLRQEAAKEGLEAALRAVGMTS
jgi:polysaccharide pyruvyl transferase CsaB